MPVKKKLIVVKSIRDVSPKKQLFVSRKAQESDNSNQLEPSTIGNSSPTKPIRAKDGNLLSRSVLGDPIMFDELDKKQKASTASSNRVGSTFRGNQSPPGTKYSNRTSGGARSPPPETKTVEIADPKQTFLAALRLQQSNAKTVRIRDSEKEVSLMKYLPVNERFSLNKEGQVLTRWQERQRDWDRIQTSITKRLDLIGAKHHLMMTTTEEHRIRREEYDMLQAAVSPTDRMGANTWHLSLRGGGENKIAVGHVFSGIECIVGRPIGAPIIIRKAATLTNKFTKSTDSRASALVHRRKQLSKTINLLRPHAIRRPHIEALTIHSMDLFQWAIESAQAFFSGVAYEGDYNQMWDQVHSNGQSLYNESSEETEIISAKATPPVLELLTSREIVFSSVCGKAASQTIIIRNTGSVAVQYSWKPLNEQFKKLQEVAAADPSKAQSINMSEVQDVVESNCACTRPHQINQTRPTFFCWKKAGEIMPGETIRSVFTFYTNGLVGSVRQPWQLECTPRAIFKFASNISDVSNTGKNNKDEYPGGILVVELHGHVATIDETIAKRDLVTRTVDKCVVDSIASDEVERCFRRLRKSVKLSDLQGRQRELFEKVNKVLIEGFSTEFGLNMPIFITVERLADFETLCWKTSEFCTTIKYKLFELQLKSQLSNSNIFDDKLEIERTTIDNEIQYREALIATQQASCCAATLAVMKNELFPEITIDVFDEVTLQDIQPTWDFSIENLIAMLSTSMLEISEIEQMEANIAKRSQVHEKQKRKQARYQAMLAALDSDEDSDIAEEDEAEEEEQEEESAVKPKHQLLLQAEQLTAQCSGHLLALLVRPVPRDNMMTAARLCLLDTLADNFDQWERAAKTVAQFPMPEDNKTFAVPTVASPFTSAEGEAAWKSMLTAAEVAPVVAAPAKGKAPAKGADKGAAASAPPNTQQVDSFYRELHASVRSGLLQAAGKMFDTVDLALEKSAAASWSEDKTWHSGHNLMNIAPLRFDDVLKPVGPEDFTSRGAVTFVNMATDVFVRSSVGLSAFDVMKNQSKQNINTLFKLSQFRPSAIVIVSESRTPQDSDNIAGDLSLIAAKLTTELTALSVADEARKDKLLKKRKRALPKPRRKHVHRPNKPEVVVKWDPEIDFDLRFVVRGCASAAELKWCIANVVTKMSQHTLVTPTADGVHVAVTIPIFVLADLSCVGVVPSEPEQPEEFSDEEDAPVCIGLEESKVQRVLSWAAHRPHKLPVTVTVAEADRPVTVDCFTDAGACVMDAFALPRTSRAELSSVWVDCTVDGLFTSNQCAALHNICNASPLGNIANLRFVSDDLRQALLWAGVLQLLPQSDALLQSAAHNKSTGVDSPSAFFSKLFPKQVGVGRPQCCVVLGGSLRADKLRVMDQLIDLVDTICLVGEFAIPFVEYAKRVRFSSYSTVCGAYTLGCKQLLTRARARGVTVVLPVDLVMGEESVSAADRLKCMANVMAEARDEGAEYEADVRTVQLGSYAEEASVPGYACDIGPESCEQLKRALESCQVALVWGTVGICEITNFQTGQRALIESTVHKPYDLDSLASAAAAAAAGGVADSKPARVLLVGESTVEWSSRVADSDGERQGELVLNGMVSYASRVSSLLCGLLGLCRSAVLEKGFVRRAPSADEWVYHTGPPAPAVEDDDEADEEDGI